MCPECAEGEVNSIHLLAHCPVKARMRYGVLGTPKMSEQDIKKLKCEENTSPHLSFFMTCSLILGVPMGSNLIVAFTGHFAATG